jgi:hypothetical protein
LVNKLKNTVQAHPKATMSFGLAVLLACAAAVFGWYARGQANEGRFGYTPNYTATRLYNASLGRWNNFKGAAPELFRADLPEAAPLWRIRDDEYLAVYGKPYVRGAQGIGDCVSWGTADAIDVSLAVACSQGKASGWKITATEWVYGLRGEMGESPGYYSDGWWGSSAGKGVNKFGVLAREVISDGKNSEDLTTYDKNRAREWGHYGPGGRGSDWMNPIAAKHKVQHVALIRTVEEAKASLANGYAFFICSGVGFEPCRRNEDGIVRRGGRWPHCMACVGYYTVRGQVVFVIENSWGNNAVSGPAGPMNLSGAQFAIIGQDLQDILDQNDSYAVSGPNGFEPQDLDFSGWGTAESKAALPRKEIAAEHELRVSL